MHQRRNVFIDLLFDRGPREISRWIQGGGSAEDRLVAPPIEIPQKIKRMGLALSLHEPRRMRLMGASLACIASLAFGCGAAGSGGDGDLGSETNPLETVDHQRADEALERLMLSYWRGSDGYLSGAPGGATNAGYWIFAQALDAVLDGAVRTQGARFVGLVETLYRAQDARGWSRDFFDDETWMTLALLRAFDATGESKYLGRAEALFADVMDNGWDGGSGGIWWNRTHTQKATASNLGPVIAGVRLSKHTGNSAYLAFAKKAYAHWAATAVDTKTHAVADHAMPSGQLVWWRFSYNEGLFVGASVELWRVTHDPAYLDAARATGAYMVAHETTSTSGGKVLFDGKDATCTGDCAAFKGIAYRYLAELLDADPAQTGVQDLLASSAHAIWDDARGASGRFGADWAAAPKGVSTLAADASATMALNLFAARSNPYAAGPTNVYEAEEAVLHGVGLEASHAGFEGWGYVAGFHAEGQSVEFTVTVPSAGKYELRFRYAAGAGTAKRLVTVDGKTAFANLAFPSTGGWDRYAAITPTLHLPAGKNTVSVVFHAVSGSTNYVNLDRLTVVATP
jgi:predicted alpha-1,6-mannanase (GH76 family)